VADAQDMMDFEPALKDLDKALRLAPTRKDAHFNRAEVRRLATRIPSNHATV
jgi:Tfp pilus assembly protein PilF